MDSAAATRRWYRRLTPERKAAYLARKQAWFKDQDNAFRAFLIRRRSSLRCQGLDLATMPRLTPGVDERCEMCGLRDDVETPLLPDHDHASGAFRGWLCGPCNSTIGFARDCPDRLRAGAEYLCRT